MVLTWRRWRLVRGIIEETVRKVTVEGRLIQNDMKFSRYYSLYASFTYRVK